MNNFIGQLQVGDGVPVDTVFKILVIVIKRSIAMVKVKHGGNSVKPETIKVKLFHPVADIGKQEFFYFPFSIIKQFRIPAFMIPPAAGMKILTFTSVKLV